MLADMTRSEYLSNCTGNSTEIEVLSSANLVFGVSGAVCSLISLVLLFTLVFFFRAYRNILQRLILYYATVVIVYQVLSGMLLVHRFHYRGQRTVCAINVALLYYMVSVMYFLSAVIVNYSMYLVLRPSKRGPLFTKSSCYKWVAECCCVGFAFVLPWTYSWTPITHNDYGISSRYCGIKTTDEDCSPANIKKGLIIIFP